jgi:hypothetical protein
MSLMQQGNQTAMNKTTKTPISITIDSSRCVFIRTWNDEAQVLTRTCPACGNFVRGQKNAMTIPSKAAGLTRYHSSMKPK